MEMVTLVDGINCLVDRDGNLNEPIADFLESQNRRVIVVSNTKDTKVKDSLKEHGFKMFDNDSVPEKKEPDFFKKLLEDEHLCPESIFYLDHKRENLGSAMQAGITHLCLWDGNLEDLKKKFSGYNF